MNFIMLLLTLCFASPSNSLAQDDPGLTGEVIVFAAASLTEPFTAIGKHLATDHPGLHVTYNFAGSQALRTQIEQGAPADVFASADAVQMKLAQENGIMQGTPIIFARNRLVVIVPKTNPAGIAVFTDLAKPGVKLDFTTPQVPLGHYSRHAISEAAAEYGSSFARQVLRNIVSEEENAKQVVTKVQLGEADAGLVYASDVTTRVSADVLTVAIPDAYNQIATYPIALTKEAKQSSVAHAFIAFVLSPAGQAILQEHGFIPHQQP